MLVTDMVTEIQEHGFEDLSTTRIVAAINDAYHDVCSRHEWTWMESSAQIANLAAGNPSLNMTPYPFRTIQKIYGAAVDGAETALRYIDFNELVNKVGNPINEDRGEPTHWYYYLGSNLIRLFPYPDAVYTYVIAFIARSVDLSTSSLTTDIKVPDHHRRVMVLGALKNLYPINDDMNAAMFFEQQYEARIQRMFLDDVSIQTDIENHVVDVYDG